MNSQYIPNPGEKHVVVDATLCKSHCDCIPSRMCPVAAIHSNPGGPVLIHHRDCLACGGCVRVCKLKALSIQR